MDNKYLLNTPAAIYIDLSKAFDNLRYGILPDKLIYYGISGIPLELIKSYFTNRQRDASYKNCESDLLEVIIEIPQGFILSPLFFLANASMISLTVLVNYFFFNVC